jgi:adenine-specific DNA-methyltransferase
VIYKDGRAASGELKKLFGDVVFNNPKDHEVLADIISYCTQNDPNAIILDFFCGSGSTAHAVLSLNAKDGGTRQHVMVQLAEVLEPAIATSPAARQTIQKAIRFLDTIGKPHTIAEISKERLRRAGKSLLSEGYSELWNRDVGFRVLKIDTSNMADVYYSPSSTQQNDLLGIVDNIKPGRDAPSDLLFQVLVDWGVDLTLPIRKETVKGKTVYFVNAEPYDLIACFDSGVSEDLVKELAKNKPVRMVFRDNGFESDAVKINVEQIFRQLSPSTDVKSI